MSLEDIQQAIVKLAPDERAKLRVWLMELESDASAQGEPESAASKWGRLAGRTVAGLRKRMREP